MSNFGCEAHAIGFENSVFAVRPIAADSFDLIKLLLFNEQCHLAGPLMEEMGSPCLVPFLEKHRDLLAADVIVVTDTDNLAAGRPAITNSLRGCLTLEVTVRTASFPSHSGTTGGGLADATLVLNSLIARLMPTGDGRYPVPGFYDRVRPLTKNEAEMLLSLESDPTELAKRFGVLPNVQFSAPLGQFLYHTTRLPALTVIAEQAGSVTQPSNQVQSEAKAVVSVRLVPDQQPDEVCMQFRDVLSKDVPYGAIVEVIPKGDSVRAWIVEPAGKVFSLALECLSNGYTSPSCYVGSGGTIGYVGPGAQEIKRMKSFDVVLKQDIVMEISASG